MCAGTGSPPPSSALAGGDGLQLGERGEHAVADGGALVELEAVERVDGRRWSGVGAASTVAEPAKDDDADVEPVGQALDEAPAPPRGPR